MDKHLLTFYTSRIAENHGRSVNCQFFTQLLLIMVQMVAVFFTKNIGPLLVSIGNMSEKKGLFWGKNGKVVKHNSTVSRDNNRIFQLFWTNKTLFWASMV